MHAPDGPAAGPASAQAKASELQHAFDLFNQVSVELTQAYDALQQRVASLTAELAVANGELRKQYLEKQALSERLTQLVSALPAGVLVVDGESRIGEANPAARAMFGGDPVGQVWDASPRLAPTGAPDEWQLDGPDGQRRVHVAISPLPVSGGRIVLLHDITAAHEMKASLERNRRLAAMGEMAAALAHQLRTPLSTALLYSANLANPDLPGEARARFADRATEQLKRLERLIQDVLLFARGESIGREAVAVAPWLAEIAATVAPLFTSREVFLDWRVEVGDAVLVGGRKALSGALINLLENALQVSESGGRVTLLAGVGVGGGRLRLAVRDEGPGVSPEMRARIFEPFYTTRGQGTGLGLAIALGVARAHGGTIEVGEADAVSRSGAEFAMILPVGRPEELVAAENP